jgi:hypothetical protein
MDAHEEAMDARALSAEIDREVERISLWAGLSAAFGHSMPDYDFDAEIQRIAYGQPPSLSLIRSG